MDRYLFPAMTVGVCDYPGHWDKALWEDDLRRMLDSGITVVRIAEFAWSLFERTEGVFTLDCFDPSLDRAAGHARFAASQLHQAAQSLFSGETAQGDVALAPYGAEFFRL